MRGPNVRMLGVCLLAAACGGSSEEQEWLEGFEPPPPGVGEIQLATPIIRDIAPGADVMLCSYLDFDAGQDLDITAYKGYASDSNHHVLLYTVENHQAAGTHECTEEDMINARYLGGSGSDTPPMYLPDGLVFRLAAGTQILMQTHWINAGDAPMSAQAVMNVTARPSTDDVDVANLFAIANTTIELPEGAGSARSECRLGQDLQLYLFGGHEHKFGTHVRITATPEGGEPIPLHETEWTPEYEFNPPIDYYSREEPLVLRAGDLVAIDCDYLNESGRPLRFPEEMCVAFGYYFPADREIQCVDGVWPTAP